MTARRGDHPRSRGVYSGKSQFGKGEAGSSPLARGLPARQPVGSGPLGIIPARAGFTVYGGYSWCDSRDHPRSRGVYSRKPLPSLLISGSSPLARGLPIENKTGRPEPGIIPARAGFT